MDTRAAGGQARSRATVRARRQGQGQNQELAAVVVSVESIGGRYKGKGYRRYGVHSCTIKVGRFDCGIPVSRAVGGLAD